MTARDLRAATMAFSARLSQLVEVGLEPARDEALRGILLRLEGLDLEHHLAVRCGLQLGKRKEERGGKEGEEYDELVPECLRDSERVTYGAAYESEVRAARVWERKYDRAGQDTIALQSYVLNFDAQHDCPGALHGDEPLKQALQACCGE